MRTVFSAASLASIGGRTLSKSGCPFCFKICQKSQPQKRHPFLADSQHPMRLHWGRKSNDKAGLNPSTVGYVKTVLEGSKWHKWQARVGDMYEGRGCPCSSGHKVCVCNSLQTLFPEVAAERDYTRTIGTPCDYTAYSCAKVWWVSSKHGPLQVRIDSCTYEQGTRVP